jgi:hypothetical protein
MTTDEVLIVDFLKQAPDSLFTRKEVSRKAKSREDFEENPNWAAGPLASLVQQGIAEQTEGGHYKLKVDKNFVW